MSGIEYAIGTQFKTRGKHARLCVVTDVYKTYNSKGELVHVRYVAEHEFMGQKLAERDIVAATIARGLVTA
jgi:hypothetical protein